MVDWACRLSMCWWVFFCFGTWQFCERKPRCDRKPTQNRKVGVLEVFWAEESMVTSYYRVPRIRSESDVKCIPAPVWQSFLGTIVPIVICCGGPVVKSCTIKLDAWGYMVLKKTQLRIFLSIRALNLKPLLVSVFSFGFWGSNPFDPLIAFRTVTEHPVYIISAWFWLLWENRARCTLHFGALYLSFWK